MSSPGCLPILHLKFSTAMNCTIYVTGATSLALVTPGHRAPWGGRTRGAWQGAREALASCIWWPQWRTLVHRQSQQSRSQLRVIPVQYLQCIEPWGVYMAPWNAEGSGRWCEQGTYRPVRWGDATDKGSSVQCYTGTWPPHKRRGRVPWRQETGTGKSA